MINRYIVPICDINKNQIYNLIIPATSISDCQDKIMIKFSEYSESDEWKRFLKDLDVKDVMIGEINDIEEL